MRHQLALLGVAAAIAFAAPAHADTSGAAQVDAEDTAVADSGFLNLLKAAGITYADPGQAVAAGRAVCGLVDRGESGLEVIVDLKTDNPGFSTDGAAQFAAIAAREYCPQQLVKKQ